MPTPRLIWELGTAYDLFISLMVLHEPADFGLRAAWAAGMRSRLPAADRDFLEQLHTADHLFPPIHWLHSLPDPKDGASALYTLERIPPAERLPTLFVNAAEKHDETSKEYIKLLQDVCARGTWNADDQAEVEACCVAAYKEHGKTISPAMLKMLPTVLSWWAEPAEFGERLLSALRAYHEVFFAEEERRIRPALDQALARAQELAERMAVPALLEELSQGVQFSETLLNQPELVLVPTYWCSPLVLYNELSPGRMLMTFGARPTTDSLVPGEAVPDALVLALKALSDPTRLRILRYLEEEALTPSQLARRLRLRPPTVIHHLTALRMAGLVQVLHPEGKEKSYAARPKAVQSAFATLQGFLESTEVKTDENP